MLWNTGHARPFQTTLLESNRIHLAEHVALLLGLEAANGLRARGMEVTVLDKEEQRFILAHEVGHIMSGHTTYRTLAIILIYFGINNLPFLAGLALMPFELALLEWYRKSELSSDRAGLLGIQNEREWERFCRLVLQRPELATDARFATNINRVAHRRELHDVIDDVFALFGNSWTFGKGHSVVLELSQADQPFVTGRLMTLVRKGLVKPAAAQESMTQ